MEMTPEDISRELQCNDYTLRELKRIEDVFIKQYGKWQRRHFN